MTTPGSLFPRGDPDSAKPLHTLFFLIVEGNFYFQEGISVPSKPTDKSSKDSPYMCAYFFFLLILSYSF